MDEIIIDDKRYISSKRAAHLTGYAKDYVGQLCREGRVPARLVGRAWYVLETAIQDHRFGVAEAKNEQEPREFVTRSILSEQWDPARYSVPEPPLLPELKKVTAAPTVAVEDRYAEPVEVSVDKTTEESWEELFTPAQEEVGYKEWEQAAQPIIAMNEIHPKQVTVKPDVPVVVRAAAISNKRSHGAWHRALSLVLMVAATLSASLAAINSGFFDAYLISANRASVITGYSIYQKAE